MEIWIIVGLILTAFIISIILMFWFENKPIRWWMRLPIVNIFSFIMIIILICIEETYLTFHPQERTRWIKSSLLQYFFE